MSTEEGQEALELEVERLRLDLAEARNAAEPPTVIWIPVAHGADTFYVCTVTLFGKFATATSRSKTRALAHALEELAAKVVNEGA